MSNPLTAKQRELLRALPRIDELLALPVARAAAATLPPSEVSRAARSLVEAVRRRILSEVPGEDAEAWESIDWSRLLEERLAERERRSLKPLINATGVVLHTNLGRAPLSDAATAAITTIARGYSNLEYDIQRGVRGSRHDHGEALLVHLSGAEAAMVVNNNAAAVLLVLSALASGGEVILSRGEMIEIGGSFRIPDVLEQSGARLVEVGTTNRTHLRDYERAITPETAALLKVHTSNYRVMGFTHSVSARELAPLARARAIPLLEDLGSGVFVRTDEYGLRHEQTVQEAVASGADVVTFSGDKLLGGPQAGVIVGRRELVERCRRHPLARAVRVDKLALAALQATLQAYAQGTPQEIPIWRMMGWSVDALRRRAMDLAESVRRSEARDNGRALAASVRVEPAESAIGGGSLPEESLPTWVVSLAPNDASWSVQELAAALRHGQPCIVGRIDGGRLLLDPRTVFPHEDELLARGVRAALSALSTGADAARPRASGGEPSCT